MTSTEAVPKELVAMGIHPHEADRSQEQPPGASTPDPEEPRAPRRRPHGDRKWPGAAMLMMLVALAVIAVLILV
jgi:hypothetical protein